MHYGVGPPPYWQFAHIHLKNVPANLEWGNSTWERVTLDIPQFFSDCEKAGHTKHNVVVVQSYLWDLARQGQQRYSPVEMADWAQNATRLVAAVRAAVPNHTKLAWRYHGPVPNGLAWDAPTIEAMNHAMQVAHPEVDFVVDYGAVLSSSLARLHGSPEQPYFDHHPPVVAQAAYLNLMLNAVLAVRSAKK
jgi:hypothetical protein